MAASRKIRSVPLFTQPPAVFDRTYLAGIHSFFQADVVPPRAEFDHSSSTTRLDQKDASRPIPRRVLLDHKAKSRKQQQAKNNSFEDCFVDPAEQDDTYGRSGSQGGQRNAE